jgi:hypothetical protein
MLAWSPPFSRTLAASSQLGPEGGALIVDALRFNDGTLKAIVMTDNHIGAKTASAITRIVKGGVAQRLAICGYPNSINNRRIRVISNYQVWILVPLHLYQLYSTHLLILPSPTSQIGKGAQQTSTRASSSAIGCIPHRRTGSQQSKRRPACSPEKLPAPPRCFFIGAGGAAGQEGTAPPREPRGATQPPA